MPSEHMLVAHRMGLINFNSLFAKTEGVFLN